MDEELKSPKEWERLTGITVLDADGWRGRTGRDFREPVSEEEFRFRAAHSTIRSTRPLYSETPKEALDRVMNEGPDEAPGHDEGDQ